VKAAEFLDTLSGRGAKSVNPWGSIPATATATATDELRQIISANLSLPGD